MHYQPYPNWGRTGMRLAVSALIVALLAGCGADGPPTAPTAAPAAPVE